MIKKITLLILSLILILIFSTFSFANNTFNNDHKYQLVYWNDYHKNLKPEQKKAYNQAWGKHQSKMKALNNELWDIERELDIIYNNPKAKQTEIDKLIEKSSEIENKMDLEVNKFNQQLSKDGLPAYNQDNYWGKNQMMRGGNHMMRGERGYKAYNQHRGRGGYYRNPKYNKDYQNNGYYHNRRHNRNSQDDSYDN